MIYDHPMKLARSMAKACARLKSLGYATGALRVGEAAYFNVTTAQGRYFEVIVREVPDDEQIANMNKSYPDIRAGYAELGAIDFTDVQSREKPPQKASMELRERLAAARATVKPQPTELLRSATATALQANAHLSHDGVDYSEWLLREWAHQVMTVNVPPAEVTDRANLIRMTHNAIRDMSNQTDSFLSEAQARNITLLKEWVKA
ncbi:hypothetical protein GURKE_00670 [Brevundimonas phage vB_BpoS-Gurke]|uniref:Uncharacterized protein n=1 Tax=Brevundimonas phage vB_BpoS-Gurke TaxID=2948599 RepID=A0A9E7SQP6_9CAUD|nr:hypothetical protein GURKE_00670 [Brevundimonas phage vB_BpoS-Gurke]